MAFFHFVADDDQAGVGIDRAGHLPFVAHFEFPEQVPVEGIKIVNVRAYSAPSATFRHDNEIPSVDHGTGEYRAVDLFLPA